MKNPLFYNNKPLEKTVIVISISDLVFNVILMATTEFLKFLHKSFQLEIKDNVDLIIDRGRYMMSRGMLLEAFILLFSASSWLCDENSQRKKQLDKYLMECNNQLAKFRGDTSEIQCDLSNYLEDWSILAYTQHLIKKADNFYEK